MFVCVTFFAFLFINYTFSLSASSIYDHPSVTCNDVTLTTPSFDCKELFSELNSLCPDAMQSEILIRDPDFRGEVICRYLNSPQWRREVETIENDVNLDGFFESEEFHYIVDEALKKKAMADLEIELRSDIEKLEKETLDFEIELTGWVLEMEQEYLNEIVDMTAELLRGETLSTAVSEPHTTTYKPLPTTNILRTKPNDFWIFTSEPSIAIKDFSGIAIAMGEMKTNDPAKVNAYCIWYAIINRAAPGGLYGKRIAFMRRSSYIFETDMSRDISKKITKEQNRRGLSDDLVEDLYMGVALRTCDFLDTDNHLRMFGYYTNMRPKYDKRGWLELSYSRFVGLDGFNNLLLLDGPEHGTWYFFNVLGSKARYQDNCTNSVPGAGIYQVSENGTCIGYPVFSSSAANVESYCTDSMWGSMNLNRIDIIIGLQYDLDNCDTHIRPPMDSSRKSSLPTSSGTTWSTHTYTSSTEAPISEPLTNEENSSADNKHSDEIRMSVTPATITPNLENPGLLQLGLDLSVQILKPIADKVFEIIGDTVTDD